MKETPQKALRKRALGGICLVLLCGLLTAGLWPFHAPENQITWAEGRQGVQFGTHGTILSSGDFRMPRPLDEDAWSLEMSVKPDDLDGSGTLLAFDSSGSVRFYVRQSNADLVLLKESRHASARVRTEKLYVDNVFLPRESKFITIISNVDETKVYVDGALRRTFPKFHVSSGDLNGRLVVGNSPVESDSWAGRLRELGIYGSALTASSAMQHYLTWTKSGRPALGAEDTPVALFLIDEGQGRLLQNTVTSGVALNIPSHFVVLHPQFLERPRTEYRATWSYWKNVMVNIGGFVPFGFFVKAYLAAKDNAKSTLVTVLSGAAVSLAIEILQAFLPTRFSGMTDLMTNTLGTFIGVVLYRRRDSFPFLPKIPAYFT